MPNQRRKQTEVERHHGHCADELMRDFGIPKAMRVEVCEEIAKAWVQCVMIHCQIIMSVRGYQPHHATRSLEHFLHTHATHSQKNHKQESWGRQHDGRFDLQGNYHEF